MLVAFVALALASAMPAVEVEVEVAVALLWSSTVPLMPKTAVVESMPTVLMVLGSGMAGGI
jgi:hypothetical protein